MIIQAPRVDYDPKDISSASIIGKAQGIYSTMALQFDSSGLNTKHSNRQINGHRVSISHYKNKIAGFIYGTINISAVSSGGINILAKPIISWQDDTDIGTYLLSGGTGKYFSDGTTGYLERYTVDTGEDDRYPEIDDFITNPYILPDDISNVWFDDRNGLAMGSTHDSVFYRRVKYSYDNSGLNKTILAARPNLSSNSVLLIIYHIEVGTGNKLLEFYNGRLNKSVFGNTIEDVTLLLSTDFIYRDVGLTRDYIWTILANTEDTDISLNKLEYSDTLEVYELVEKYKYVLPSLADHSYSTSSSIVFTPTPSSPDYSYGSVHLTVTVPGEKWLGPSSSTISEYVPNQIKSISYYGNTLSLFLISYTLDYQSDSTLDKVGSYKIYNSSGLLYNIGTPTIADGTTGSIPILPDQEYTWFPEGPEYFPPVPPTSSGSFESVTYGRTYEDVTNNKTVDDNTTYKNLVLTINKDSTTLDAVETVLESEDINLVLSSSSKSNKPEFSIPFASVLECDDNGRIVLWRTFFRPIFTSDDRWPTEFDREDAFTAAALAYYSNWHYDSLIKPVTSVVVPEAYVPYYDNTLFYMYFDGVDETYVKRRYSENRNVTFNKTTFSCTTTLIKGDSSTTYNYTATESIIFTKDSLPYRPVVDPYNGVVGTHEYNPNAYGIIDVLKEPGNKGVRVGSTNVISVDRDLDFYLHRIKGDILYPPMEITAHRPVTITN